MFAICHCDKTVKTFENVLTYTVRMNMKHPNIYIIHTLYMCINIYTSQKSSK